MSTEVRSVQKNGILKGHLEFFHPYLVNTTSTCGRCKFQVRNRNVSLMVQLLPRSTEEENVPDFGHYEETDKNMVWDPARLHPSEK